MADLVNEMLDKFMALLQEDKQISADMDAAFKEYNDYCASSENDLNEKIGEIHEKMHKLDYLIEYAKEHAMPENLEEAATPFETSAGQLESIRQTIKLDSHNDPNAERLYTKVTGQKLFYEQKIEQTRHLIEGSKVQAKRQYDSDVSALNERKEKHDENVKAYIQSNDFKEYLKLLTFDKSAFNSPGTANLPSRDFISLGQRRVKLTVPMEVENELSAISNGEYNAAARTIGAPYQISTKKGGVLYLDYDDRNRAYLMGGIQRLLLNLIKYVGQDITDMLFCEPATFSADSLGNIAALGKGINPFITVPQSLGEAEAKLEEFTEAAQTSPTPDKVSRVLVLCDFPENYMGDMTERAAALCRIARQNGVLVLLTHGMSADETPVEREMRMLSTSIRSRNGGFWLEEQRESLFWYSAPSDIPEEIRRVYVDLRRQQGAQAAHEHEAAAVQPAPVAPGTAGAAASAVATAVSAAPSAPVEAVQTVQPAQPVEQVQPVQPVNEVHEEPPHVAEFAPPVHEEIPVHEPVPQPAQAVQPEPVHSAPEPIHSAPEVHNEHVPGHKAPEHRPPVSAKGVKGSRALPEIKVGMDVGSDPVNIDLGGVAFICGSRGGDREMLTDRIITQIIAVTHPDDAELWLFDCGGGELAKYSENPAPHIKYDVADSDEETAFDLIDVVSAKLEKRVIEFERNGWADYSAVPANVLMPRVFVVINEFTKLLENIGGAPRYFGRNYTTKLSRLFRSCNKYGIHFLLTAEAFFENGKRPACFEGVTVHCGMAVSGCDIGVKEMFSHIKLYENEIESLKKVPDGCAFTAAEGSAEGLTMVRILTAQMPLDIGFTAVPEYSENYGVYVDKHPLLADRKLRVSREDRSAARAELIAARGKDETLLFLGEPCRFRAEYPIRLYEEFGENLLVIAPEREKSGAAAMAAAALQSLKEQGIAAEVLAWKSNPVYAELKRSGALEGVNVLESEDAEKRVKELSADIAAGKHSAAFEIVLGGDLMMAAMHADDCLADLKRALVKGSRFGVHFMFVSGSVAQLATGFISLFRHKLVFSCPRVEAEKILRDTSCDLPESAFRLSNDYDELTMAPYLL